MPGKHNSKREFYTRERCFLTECWNTPDDPGVSIARVRVEPGVTTEKHCLDGVDERYVVVSGAGVVELGSVGPRDIASGDVVRIRAGEAQRVTNTGDKPLVFYCVCTPRFVDACYVSLEEG